MSEQQLETPKEKQSENYDLFKQIIEDIKTLRDCVSAIQLGMKEIEQEIQTLKKAVEW